MKFLRIILLVTIVVSSNNISFSQIKKKEYQDEIEKLNCAKNSNIGFKKRLENYPYNLTSHIKFISYENKEDGIIGDELKKYLNLLVEKKDSVIENTFDEIKILTFKQIEKLTDIVYNYGFEAESDIMDVTKCYMPRNAILFFDNENKLLGFIEICFDCDNYRTIDKRLTLGEKCSQKLDLIKNLFNEVGIKYGVTEVE